jgi:hypothetical protein
MEIETEEADRPVEPAVKPETEDIKMEDVVEGSSGERKNSDGHRRGGWFDIVMGSNEDEETEEEEEPAQKRKYLPLANSL